MSYWDILTKIYYGYIGTGNIKYIFPVGAIKYIEVYYIYTKMYNLFLSVCGFFLVNVTSLGRLIFNFSI